MDRQYFIKLLHKYQQGKTTKEEQQFLESYYNLFQNESDFLSALSTDEKNRLKQSIKENIWNSISREEEATQKTKFIYRRFSRVAAAAVFIGLLGGLFFLYNMTSERQRSKDLVNLQSARKFTSPSVAAQTDHQNENRIVFLPDGSKVILSPGSRLNYPSSFDGMEKREVFLYGQAFFDVKHNASRPFVVRTGKLQTVVLGTAFNIKAMAGEKDITVTVKRGKVKVSDEKKVLGIIIPNQQITYNTEKVSSDIKIIGSDSYLDWKNQDLFIDNLTLSEAAKILEDRYKVKINIRDSSMLAQRFTATFQKNETLDEALMSISVFNGVEYLYNKEKSVITLIHK